MILAKTLVHKILIFFVILFAFTATSVIAQEEDDEYEEDAEVMHSVFWSLGIDGQGKATSNLSITPANKVPDVKAIQEVIAVGLQEALQCAIENVNVQSGKYSFDHSASCPMPVQKSDLLVRAMVKPSPLLNRLRKAGLSRANLSIAVPKLGYNQSPEGGKTYTNDQNINYTLSYDSPVQEIKDISFAFGYSNSYVFWMTSVLLAILISPILLILFIRVKTLKLAARDSTAAWFGYWRVHRWIAEGIWAVWFIAISVFHLETFLQFIYGQDSPVLNAAMYLLPPGIVSFACQYLTRPLWSKVRGVTWNRGEMLINAFWQHVAAVLPMAFIFIGIGSLVQDGAAATFWLGAAVAVQLLGAWQYGKATKTLPNALHGGELKEKILDMAHRAGVKIQQVLLMPASRMQMGNAFAMQGQRVMITDYLLERLTKPETDCVMAHEIGHVKKRHVFFLSWPGFLLIFFGINIALRIALTIIPAFLPAVVVKGGLDVFTAMQWIEEYLLYALSLIFTLLFVYLLSRRFERSADEFAALLTNDPESMITGLVKLSKMNLMPLRWGRWDEGLSTHPSSLRRIEAIAKEHNISKERLRELLVTEPRQEEGTGYTLDKASFDESLVFSSEKKTKSALIITLLVLSALSLPPLLLAKLIGIFGLPTAAYAAGIVAMPLIYLSVTAYASLTGYASLRQRLREKNERKGIKPGEPCYFTGLVPEQFPRVYDSNTVWDVGFMTLEQGAIVYQGDKAAFSIPRENIVRIDRGMASPNWFDVPETYITWTDGGKDHVFHIHSLDGGSMLSIAKQSGILLRNLLEWHRGTGGAVRGASGGDYGLPQFPDVKGQHPRQSAKLSNLIGLLLVTAAFVFSFASLLHLEAYAAWYGIGMAVWCLLISTFPVWRYRESADAIPALPNAIARDKEASAATAFARVEKQRKINRRLAWGVGVLGIGSQIALYAAFIFVMSSYPGTLPGFALPSAYPEAMQSDGSHIYQFTRKFDMSTFDPQGNKQLQTRHFAALLEGTSFSVPREIPAFYTVAASERGVVLFGDGFYADYDGVTVKEVKTEGIGKWPKGIATPRGLFVVSRFKDGTKLTHVEGPSFTVVPLPDEIQSRNGKVYEEIEPLWYGDHLALFWPGKATLNWTLGNGTTWEPAITQPFSGSYKVIGDGKSIHFFHEEREEGDEGERTRLTINHYIFENNVWSAASRLPIPGYITDWKVFMHRGTAMLFIRQDSAETLYGIDKGRLINPVVLKAGDSSLSKVGSAALVALLVNVIIGIIVYIASALIGRYKKQDGPQGAGYEFASLFRRFLAKAIDVVVMLLPSLILIWYSLSGVDAGQKPLSSALPVRFILVSYFVGGFFYHALCEGLFGATAGKKACGIKVLTTDFTPIGLGSAFLRNALRVIDGFWFYVVGATALSGTLKWQRFGDMLAETVVVRGK